MEFSLRISVLLKYHSIVSCKPASNEVLGSHDKVFLILDATTGQNAIQQAIEFQKVAPITGIILTKLDGTAKGGVVIAIANELNIPVRYIGVGEQMYDLQLFEPEKFVEALFGSETGEETEILE